jgi:antitoxin (DNA-binding transcriptional repressor) of toxin-antitoxin stability system
MASVRRVEGSGNVCYFATRGGIKEGLIPGPGSDSGKEHKKMKTLSIREARQALTHLESLLAEEGELTITRRGEPIARVLPIGKKRPMPSHSNLRENMPRLRDGSEQIVREDRDAR